MNVKSHQKYVRFFRTHKKLTEAIIKKCKVLQKEYDGGADERYIESCSILFCEFKENGISV
jgi:hypothetical protein